MVSVFISYSSKNETTARKIEAHLRSKGHEVWLDKLHIWAGMNYVQEIAKGIDKTDVFMPLLSPASVQSRWVWKEICYAVEKGKTIAPVLVQFTELPVEVAFVLAGLHHVDFEHSEEPWEELSRALEAPREGSVEVHAEVGQRANRRFLALRRRMRAALSSPLLVGLLVLLATWLLLPRLPSPSEIIAPGASASAQHALEVAYTRPVQDASGTPEAAITALWRPRAGGQWQRLENGQDLSSADQYLLAVMPREQVWCYVFQIDAQGNLFPLFPALNGAPFATGVNPIHPGQWNLIPEGSEAFYLDETLGVEHIYVVVASAPWPELEAALTARGGAPASTSTPPTTVLTAFNMPSRGVAGKEAVASEALPLPDSGIVQATFTWGLKGAFVEAIYFQHVSP